MRRADTFLSLAVQLQKIGAKAMLLVVCRALWRTRMRRTSACTAATRQWRWQTPRRCRCVKERACVSKRMLLRARGDEGEPFAVCMCLRLLLGQWLSQTRQ